MIFEGRVNRVLQVESGTSKNGTDWKKQKFVFEYFENPTDRYSDKVLLELWGDRVDLNLKEGEPVRCGFGISVREYNGNIYNEVRLYKIERLTAGGGDKPEVKTEQPAAPAAVQQQPAPAQAAGGERRDDLPF